MRSRSRASHHLAIAAAGLGLVLVTACQAGETASPVPVPASTTTTTIATISKDDFPRQANAICNKTNDDALALTESLSHDVTDTAEATVSLLRGNSRLVADSVDKLRALPQPARDAAALVKMYDDSVELATLANGVADAIVQGDDTTRDRLAEQADALQHRVNTDLTAYGLTECGKGG